MDEDDDEDDLNVEHIQFLLVLFHSLSLMQKKQILLQTASGLIKISKQDLMSQLMSSDQMLNVSRLLLIFEYMIRHLYEPPKDLMEQIQANIFHRYHNSSTMPSRPKYYAFSQFEDINR